MCETGDEGRSQRAARHDELDVVCDAVNSVWGIHAKVEVVREYHAVQRAEDSPVYWRVRVHHGEGAHIEVCHPDRRVALGMAMAAITVEGL